MWLLGPSAEAAKELLGLFRTPQADAPMFRFGNADSRFLGDLYQDISENVRKRYALLQTPRFVERFILDRTLDPAIERFGLNDTNLIDPTCGSGHFLLGAFDRLFDRRLQAEPGLDVRQAAAKALDAVAGSDVNPYAVAIAKFRLTLSFIEKAGYAHLKDAPKLPLHVVVADSLLHNPYAKGQQSLGDMKTTSVEAWKGADFKLEDEQGARDVLYNRRYAAVVGNPPYITVKDSALRERYREIYSTAFRSYSLAVPFKERFFQLAKNRGFVGMITANSFMRREFGKKLIKEYLPSVNLEIVINTAGAYIPGHGTPTVLLFGTQEKPQSETVLTILASGGEPTTPEDPEQGQVWNSIVNHWDDIGFDNEFITVTRTSRGTLAKHPWSLGGGGAAELKGSLEDHAEMCLTDLGVDIGTGAVTRENDLFVLHEDALVRWGIPAEYRARCAIGENVRDWAIHGDDCALWPYSPDLAPVAPESVVKALWPWRTQLARRVAFGKTQLERGLPWCGYSMYFADRMRTPLTIAFALVASHNQFVLERGGKAFLHSAPIIKLPVGSSDDAHYALLAYLNSSTACFWMKQVGQKKTATTGEKILQPDPAKIAYEFSATAIGGLPLPHGMSKLAKLGRLAAGLASDLKRCVDEFDIVGATALSVSAVEQRWKRLLKRLAGAQEAIDIECYQLFNFELANDVIVAEYMSRCMKEDQGVTPDERPFITGSGPVYEVIRRSSEMSLIEMREFKRRWIGVQGRFQAEGADCRALLEAKAHSTIEDSVETVLRSESRVLTRRAIIAGAAQKVHSILGSGLVSGEAFSDGSVVGDSSVSFLAACRFTDSGLEKYAAWEETWVNQRREDAGEPDVTCAVPPKYAQEDFRDANYWRLRGKLDVPKERFISYPGCESDEDHEPVYGWAGWNHLQRAQALAQLYNDRRAEGWRADRKDEKPKAAADDQAEDSEEKPDKKPSDDRLVPMLAGLLELLPWLLQWHNEPSEELGGQRPGEQFALFLEGQCAEWGLTHEDLRSWRPKAKRSRTASSKKSES